MENEPSQDVFPIEHVDMSGCHVSLPEGAFLMISLTQLCFLWKLNFFQKKCQLLVVDSLRKICSGVKLDHFHNNRGEKKKYLGVS